MFNGALGRQSLDTWDPTATGPNPGYYATHDCPWDNSTDFHPECNYNRVRNALLHNGYDERQVQVVLIYSSNSYPTCDMKAAYCSDYTKADAYISETYLGRILRYLKCCKMDANGNSTGQARYLHLQQVFVTSRTYGGYANGQPTTTQHCLMPEPYAYEESFGLQRTIVAQINRTTTDYAGDVRYPESAPWTDWGPYLWADGPNISPSTGLYYCDSSTDTAQYHQCLNNPGDVRFGDLMSGYTQFWGDHTHPTAWGTKKVADRLVTFFTQSTMNGGSPFVQAWKGQ
jgi:hypothetical protein